MISRFYGHTLPTTPPPEGAMMNKQDLQYEALRLHAEKSMYFVAATVCAAVLLLSAGMAVGLGVLYPESDMGIVMVFNLLILISGLAGTIMGWKHSDCAADIKSIDEQLLKLESADT